VFTERLQTVSIQPLRPALMAIKGALTYLGGPSLSKFYADLLPQLDVVKFGARTFVTIASLDRLISQNRRSFTAQSEASAVGLDHRTVDVETIGSPAPSPAAGTRSGPSRQMWSRK
jgi:hypothetical protein